MPDSPGVALPFIAGMASFVSPCCLPLVPGYLAVVSGPAPGLSRRRLDPQVIGRSLLFVSSFSAIFVALGLTATALGAFLFRSQPTLNTVAGAAIAAMGLLLAASVFVARFNREWRPPRLVERAGRGGPVVAGAAFAVAWTPCVGPTLAAILGLAATQQSTPEAAALLAVYSAGLAIPFLVSAIGFSAAERSLGWFKRHYAAVQVAAGILLAVMGVLVVTGELFRLNIAIRRTFDDLGLDFLNFLWRI
jgi:cytochrome c-type biogenesis protein